MTCGTSYLHSYILSKFQMERINDFPKHPAIKETIQTWTNEPKLKVFNQVMDEVVADLFIPFEVEGPGERVDVTVRNQKFEVTVAGKEFIKIPMIINNTRITIAASLKEVRKGVTVHACGVDIHLKSIYEDNTLKTYALNFLQWYFNILQMKDAIREGDMNRLNIILKHMIPFFYSHSVLSKYLVECMDYILKTEHTLSPYMSLKVRAGTFVNLKGKKGKNKAADMQKENKVKYLKNLIRSLGANKIEKSIVSITKGPIMLDIAENFDVMTGSKKMKTTHKMISRENDIEVLSNKLKGLGVWDQCQTPVLSKSHPRSPFAFDHDVFKTTITSKIERMLLDVPVVDEDD